jgi:S-adenosylmethionine:tRNA ribosyltransferase-isomerase
MKAATVPVNRARMLVVRNRTIEHSSVECLADFLERGDVVVVNDAATLPASLAGRTVSGARIELRLLKEERDLVWSAIAFGSGDWRTPTELRSPPPHVVAGDRIFFDRIAATIIDISPASERLLTLRFDVSIEEFWRFVYARGTPIQYSYMTSDLKLWSVQNVYASRPWAVEMPSAGHALTWKIILALLDKGIRVVSLTHAAGISSSGDERIDRQLPLEERFEIPDATIAAIEGAKSQGHRVIAVGTSVVRALESYGMGMTHTTSLRIGVQHKLRVVDGILTGTHDATESHYQLLSAFVSSDLLARVGEECEREGYLTHEYGDACLIFNHSATADRSHSPLFDIDLNIHEARVA